MELIKKKEEEMNVFSVTYDNIDLLDSHALAIRHSTFTVRSTSNRMTKLAAFFEALQSMETIIADYQNQALQIN